MVQEHLFVPKFCSDIFKNNDLLLIGQPRQVLVIDEPSPDKFIEGVNITTEDLGRAIVDAWDNDLRKLWQICRAAAESVASREPRTELIGRDAMQEIVDHAGGTDQLGKLLLEVKAEAPLQHEYVIVRIDMFMDEKPKSYQVLIDGKVHFIPSALASPIDGLSIWVSKGYAIKKKLPIASEFEENPQAPNPEEDIPLNFQTDLLKVLAREFEKFKSGLPYNSALVITPFAIKPTIRLSLRRPFSVPDHTPIIFLDGQGDQELLSTLTGRTIQTWSASIPAGTRIIQVVDGQYGVTSLWDSKQKKPRRTLMRLLEKVVFPLAAKAPEDTVIITWKKVADGLREFQRKGVLSPRVAIAHYGNLEGTNDYENRRINILLGTPQDNPSHLEQFANALFIDDEIPISMERETVWKRYRYTDSEGNGYEAKTEAYADARVQMLARLCCEQELVQAAHRVRPIRHADREIYLITSLPIDDLPPTQLTTVNDLAQAVGGMPEVNRIDKRVAHEVFKDVLAGEEMVWSVAFKSALRQTFCNHIISNVDSEDAKREAWCDFPNDSTIWRWLREFAQAEGLERTRVVIDRRHRAQGGGGTWLYVYHPEHLDEATVRAQFAPDLDIEEADVVWVEPDAYENAEKWPDEWGGDPTWVRRWDTGEKPPTDTGGNDGRDERTED
jgi:hypothetical protein